MPNVKRPLGIGTPLGEASPAVIVGLLMGGGFAIIAAVAYLVLGERMTPGQWVGVVLVLAGVIIIAVKTPAGAAGG